MTKEEILAKVDHTLLKQTATWEEIQKLCDEAAAYHTASVCIPPCYVARAAEYLQKRTAVCTVIGFPNGNTTTAAKRRGPGTRVRTGRMSWIWSLIWAW